MMLLAALRTRDIAAIISHPHNLSVGDFIVPTVSASEVGVTAEPAIGIVSSV
jgi:hypothetical protein